MTKGEVLEAFRSGHRASDLLLETMKALTDDHHCPEASGFEGPETFSDCGRCVKCVAADVMREIRG